MASPYYPHFLLSNPLDRTFDLNSVADLVRAISLDFERYNLIDRNCFTGLNQFLKKMSSNLTFSIFLAGFNLLKVQAQNLTSLQTNGLKFIDF